MCENVSMQRTTNSCEHETFFWCINNPCRKSAANPTCRKQKNISEINLMTTISVWYCLTEWSLKYWLNKNLQIIMLELEFRISYFSQFDAKKMVTCLLSSLKSIKNYSTASPIFELQPRKKLPNFGFKCLKGNPE